MVLEGVLRRLPRIGAGLVFGAAAIVAVAVIPPVSTDPLARKPDAAIALLVNVIANLAVGAALLRTSLTTRRARCFLGGVVALVLGLALLDAALAMLGHGPRMLGVAVALFVCVAADLAAGALAFTAAVLRLPADRRAAG